MILRTDKYISSAYYNYQHNCLFNKLKEAYKKPSQEKQIAYQYCRRQYAQLNGHNFRIVSYNGWYFAVGFTITVGYYGKLEECFVWITKYGEFFCPVKFL